MVVAVVVVAVVEGGSGGEGADMAELGGGTASNPLLQITSEPSSASSLRNKLT